MTSNIAQLEWIPINKYMLKKNNTLKKKIFVIIMITISIYLLFVIFGIYLNGNIAYTYGAVSLDDIEYVIVYSKLLLIYISLIIIVLLYLFKNIKWNG